MQRFRTTYLSKKHEVKMLELRHERKSEGRKLDGLKKMLLVRIQAESIATQPRTAA
jgi:hypothetical protein